MTTDDARWTPPPLPGDPNERKKIRTRLIILAAMGILAHIISVMAR